MLIVDTAGRLHNKKNLMDELAKINRVLARELPESSTAKRCWCSTPPRGRTR